MFNYWYSDVVVAIRGYMRMLSANVGLFQGIRRMLSANVGLFQGLRRMLSALLKTHFFSHQNLLTTVCGKFE